MTDQLKSTPIAVLSPSPEKRMYVRDALSQAGFHKVKSYMKPIELWSQVEKSAPGLILTEYRNLFAGDGLELINQIRKDPKHFHIGCVIMSAKVDKAHITSSIESDADEFLALPFSTKAIQDSALRALQKRLNPTPYMKSLHHATLHINKRHYPEAQNTLMKAIHQTPAPATAHYYLGFIQLIHQKLDGAMEFFEKGLASHPFHLKCLLARAFLFKRLGKSQTFKVCLEQILELQPCHPQSNQEMTRIHLVEGNFREVLNRLNQILAFRRDFPKLNDILLVILPEILEAVQKKDPILYESLLKRIRDIHPSSHEFSETMILKLSSLGSHDEARNLFQDYKKSFSPNPVFETRWMMELVRQNAYKEAMQAGLLFKIQFGETEEIRKLLEFCQKKLEPNHQ